MIHDDTQPLGANSVHRSATNLPVIASDADALSVKAEAFAQRYTEHGNASRALREAFDTSGMSAASIKTEAYRMVHSRPIAARIHELRNAVAEQFVVSTAALKQRQFEIATAPPLGHLRIYNCRHCRGVGNRYQWTDEAELIEAVEKYQAALNSPKPEPMPKADGGFGFDCFAPVNPECRTCLGVGVRVMYLPDTTQLEGAEAASFRGVSVDRWGVITLEQHDPQQAAFELHRMIPGAIAPQRSESKVAHVHVEPLRDLTPEQIVQIMTEQKLIT